VRFGASGTDLGHFQHISKERRLTGAKRTDWFLTGTNAGESLINFMDDIGILEMLTME
jgi:hypothetical protein